MQPFLSIYDRHLLSTISAELLMCAADLRPSMSWHILKISKTKNKKLGNFWKGWANSIYQWSPSWGTVDDQYSKKKKKNGFLRLALSSLESQYILMGGLLLLFSGIVTVNLFNRKMLWMWLMGCRWLFNERAFITYIYIYVCMYTYIHTLNWESVLGESLVHGKSSKGGSPP